MEHLTACWHYDNGTTAYINNSVEAEINDGTVFEFIGEATDKYYFGFSRRFEMLAFDIETAGSYGARTWEYSDDSTDPDSWTRLIPITDNSFSTDSYVTIRVPADWASVALTTAAPHAVASVPDSVARYWLRVSVASVTTTATINDIECIPYARYTTPAIIAGALQVPDFSSSTQPTDFEVEDTIRRMEGKLDYLVKKSWRYNVTLNEPHEFNLSGIRLNNTDIRSIISLSIYNGSDWETKTEGRTHEYFFIPELGELYFSRYFLLPARMAFVGPHWWGWGIGEFSYPVRISYVWGRDLDLDRSQGPMITDLTTKMAAMEIFRSHNYSILTVSGTDHVDFGRKIDQWKMDVDEGTSDLRGWVVI